MGFSVAKEHHEGKEKHMILSSELAARRTRDRSRLVYKQIEIDSMCFLTQKYEPAPSEKQAQFCICIQHNSLLPQKRVLWLS